jgi:CheY-like chemotaxis protein
MANVLLIEDDLDARDMLGRFLSQAGYGTLTAANGWEGLLALEQPVDLILLDLMLPGLDGFAFLRIMRRQPATRNIPVVAVTAMNVTDVTQQLNQLGVTDVVSKGQNLFQHLRVAMRRHLEPPQLHSRIILPERDGVVRPFFELCLKRPAWA